MRFAVILIVLIHATPAQALEPEPNAVLVRVIDTGQGHSAIAVMPGNHFMLYDTGFASTVVVDRVAALVAGVHQPVNDPHKKHWSCASSPPPANASETEITADDQSFTATPTTKRTA